MIKVNGKEIEFKRFPNGETLEYESGYVSSFNIAKDYEIVKITIKPSEDSVITISDNKQVTDTTVFID